MINKEKVKNIAKLARIDLTDKEVEKYKEDFSSILDYFEQLKNIEFSDNDKLNDKKVICNITRKDEVKKVSSEQRKKIVELFPRKKEDYLKVKSIL